MLKRGFKKNFLNTGNIRRFLGYVIILALTCLIIVPMAKTGSGNNVVSASEGFVQTNFQKLSASQQTAPFLVGEAPKGRRSSVSSWIISPESLESHNFLSEAYPNILDPAAINFDDKGLYFAIDGAIAKFTELKERKSTYTEVVRNCGGSNPKQTNRRKDIGSDINSPFLHPRWSGGFALGPMSAKDSIITAYTSTYGDGSSPVYRNYRVYNGGSSIFEKTDFRAEASKGSISGAGGAAVDSLGQYWKQSGSLGKDLTFLQQDQTTGAFNRYSGIKSSIPGDTAWGSSRVTGSFEFGYEDDLYILAFDEGKNELWLYTLDVTDKRNIKAIQRKLITGELSDKATLFDKGNNSRTNGLVWWNDYWWVIRQDNKSGNPNSNVNPDAAVYRIDPKTGASILWVKGITIHAGEGSCWDRTWVGGLGSVERIPKNPGAKLDVGIKADKDVVKRGETVNYTISIENNGWSPYAGEIRVNFADVLKTADRIGDVTLSDSGQTRRQWTVDAAGSAEWVGVMPPHNGKITIGFSARVKEDALDGTAMTSKVVTEPGRSSNCPADSDVSGDCIAEVKIYAPADLEIHKKLVGKVSDYGVATYRITAKNLGGAAYTGVIVDNLTGNLAKAFYDESRASAVVDNVPRGKLKQDGNKLVWNENGETFLGPGETLVISYEMRLSTAAVR